VRRVLVVALACLATLPAAASGSTAKIVIKDSCNGDLACSKYNGGTPLPIVTYVAAAGEANLVAVARAGDVITISDPAATIAPEAPCQAVDPHQVACSAAPGPVGISGFDAHLADGDDTLSIAGILGTASTLDGGDGSDTLRAGPDDDTLDGGPGADRLDGGAGEDVLSFSGRSAGVVVDGAAGRTSDGDAYTGIETVLGGAGADRLLGGPGPDVFRGGPGKDTLRGAGGDDTLSGELGADRLEGGAGADLLDGDPPQGDAYYTPVIKLRRDVLRGGAGNDQLSDSGGANLLVGGSGDDLLDGGVGADRLEGGSGVDRIQGGRGRDTLRGGAGLDLLRGGSGADALSGGGGIDRLFGGAGADRISARDGLPERVACGSGRDTARVDANDRVRACENLRPRRYTSRR
jgi:Ca2+-binding RTX toxin-like protein